ncbi:MAG: nucleoside deaminase [Gammaproteobacteria bacterium]|nr:nucleoside deaminase [Gammaproteobacteria bacterium]
MEPSVNSLLDTDQLADRLLEVLELDIIPRTHAAVSAGNKLFGAAIVRKQDLSVVVVATNRETENPLWHGEISCLNDYWAMPSSARPSPSECVFFSTHEPCSMCLSAITWSGFDRFHYFFTYQDSRDEFAIPHDLRILEEVFHCTDGRYARSNPFWVSASIGQLIDDASNDRQSALRQRSEAIRVRYAELSAIYQSRKHEGHIPLR